MLNTDLHNPQVRKRMDLQAYSRNLRGVNENKDFDPEYLVRPPRSRASLRLTNSSLTIYPVTACHLRVNQEARDRPSRRAPEFCWFRIWMEGITSENSTQR